MKVPFNNELLEKIKKITIKTRRAVTGFAQGSFRSVRKGMGLDFESLRDYIVSDDIRFIDWKASARSQSLLVKEFYQEQSLAVMVALDVSASMDFGSGGKKKIETAFELASAIILMAHYSGDSVGLVIYSDTVHVSIPARKGVLHTQHLLETIAGFELRPHAKTKIKSTIDFLLGQKLNNAFLFVVSDAFEEDFCGAMAIFAQKYHLYVMRCQDKREHTLPAGVWLAIRGNEEGLLCYGNLKNQLNQKIKTYHQNQSEQMARSGAKIIDAFSTEEGIDALVGIFNAAVL